MEVVTLERTPVTEANDSSAPAAAAREGAGRDGRVPRAPSRAAAAGAEESFASVTGVRSRVTTSMV
ncbi:MAG: hypothetical protein ACHQNE_05635, partial [Candidatus Kapaibacterium sp.]